MNEGKDKIAKHKSYFTEEQEWKKLKNKWGLKKIAPKKEHQQ